MDIAIALLSGVLAGYIIGFYVGAMVTLHRVLGMMVIVKPTKVQPSDLYPPKDQT